jgi:sporulation protein YlmC with PRC-barrel domain
MLFIDMRSRPVVATSSATTLARVGDVVVDPRSRSIVALRVQGSGSDDVVHWPDIAGIGPDAVTVASADAVRDAEGRVADLLSGSYGILGKRLLADNGDELGRVMDIRFEPTTGAVTEVITTGGRVEGHRLMGCGSYAAVVRAEDAPVQT